MDAFLGGPMVDGLPLVAQVDGAFMYDLCIDLCTDLCMDLCTGMFIFYQIWTNPVSKTFWTIQSIQIPHQCYHEM